MIFSDILTFLNMRNLEVSLGQIDPDIPGFSHEDIQSAYGICQMWEERM